MFSRQDRTVKNFETHKKTIFIFYKTDVSLEKGIPDEIMNETQINIT